VALRQVSSHQELSPDHIEKVIVSVLILNIPVNAFTEDGLELIGREVGTPVSLPVHGFIYGRRFVKLKVMIPIGEAVKDRVKVDHPTLGELTLYCSYKKVSHICIFCGKLGHEIGGCKDRTRLSILLQMPGQECYRDSNILAPKKGMWITNPTLAPSTCAASPTDSVPQQGPNPILSQGGIKRSHESSTQGVIIHYERQRSNTNERLNVHDQEFSSVCLDEGSKLSNKRPRPRGITRRHLIYEYFLVELSG
jgi:hypothetical protein